MLSYLGNQGLHEGFSVSVSFGNEIPDPRLEGAIANSIEALDVIVRTDLATAAA